MTVEGVKSKSESFFSISHGVLELWRKNLRGGGFRPGSERVKLQSESLLKDIGHELLIVNNSV